MSAFAFLPWAEEAASWFSVFRSACRSVTSWVSARTSGLTLPLGYPSSPFLTAFSSLTI
jgi:hypothetical protein